MEIEQSSVRIIARVKVLGILIIAMLGLAVCYLAHSDRLANDTFSRIVQSSSSSSTDYPLFIAPYLSNIEQLRAYLMLPPNPNQTPNAKIGYNPTYGLIQGDYVCGGYQALGSSLNNNDLIVGKGLDYLNSLQGISTNVEANTRMYLAMQWNNVQPTGWSCTKIMTQSSWVYPCTDKHELLFGKASPCYQAIMSSCPLSGGNEAFITSYAGVQMVVESGVGGSCLSAGGALNNLGPFINLLWLQGDSASTLQAKQLFNATLSNWTPTLGTGIGGTIGGCFSSPYGPNPGGGAVARTRDLGFWLNMARATGLWNSSSLALSVTQEAVNQIWAQQKPDGSIAVDYPTSSPPPCGGTASTYPKDSGESDGLTIAAFDPRVPGWFAGQGSTPNLSATFSVTPASATINQQITFTATAVGGTQPYTYSWSFGDGAISVGETVTHSYSTAGTFSVAVGVTDSTHQSTNASQAVTISPPLSPDFTMVSNKPSLTLQNGTSSSATVTISSIESFSGTVTLSVSVTPSGVSAALSLPTVGLSPGGSGTTSLQVSTFSSTPLGAYSVNVTGISASLSHSITLAVTVVNSVPADFSMSASPSSLTLTAGGSASSTVTVTSLNGFAGTISLSLSPSSGPTASLSRTNLALSVGVSKTFIVTINAMSGLAAGKYSVTVTGVSGSLANSLSLALIINANLAPSLSVPGSETVNTGAFLVFTVNASDPNGNQITLLASGLPLGAAFNPHTGIFSWTPGANQTGTYDIIFTVTDNVSPAMTTTKTTTVQVNRAPTNPPPTNPPRTNNPCTYCSIVPAMPTTLWLLMTGGFLGLITSLALFTIRARFRLQQMKRMVGEARA